MVLKEKIAVFRHDLLPLSETFISEQIKGLGPDRVCVLGRKWMNREHFGLPSGGVINPCSNLMGRFSELCYLFTGMSSVIDRAIVKNDVRLIHAHFGVEGVYARPFAKRHHIPLVTTFHGFDATRSVAALFLSGKISWLRYAFGLHSLQKDGDLFIAVSNFIRQKLLDRGFPENRTVVHYIGVDIDKFYPAECFQKVPTILTVGRLVEKKGTEVLINALYKIREKIPDVLLIVAGDGPKRAELEELVGYLDLVNNVKFLGNVQHEDVVRLLTECQVFCLPSIAARDGDSEGLGMVFLEAMATARPVVGTRHGGIPEVIRDGENGFLVSEKNADALAVALLQILESKDLMRRMGACGREFAEVKFDLKKQTRQLEQIYHKLIAVYDKKQ